MSLLANVRIFAHPQQLPPTLVAIAIGTCLANQRTVIGVCGQDAYVDHRPQHTKEAERKKRSPKAP
jgi:hypothetical protein